MDIRIASIKDLPNILDLYKELNPEDIEIDKNTAETIWKNSEPRNNITYLVAIENLEIIATCNISIIDNLTRSGSPFGIIENVVTKKEFRRRGIGKGIIEKAVEIAKMKNCYKVILLSSSKRVKSHRFYESIGFNGNTKKGFELSLS